MELLNYNENISPRQVDLLVLGGYLNEIKKGSTLLLEKLGLCSSQGSTLAAEFWNGDLGVRAFDIFLQGKIPIQDTFLDEKLGFLIYGKKNVSMFFYRSDENNSSVISSGILPDGSRYTTYKLILMLNLGSVETSFQSVVTLNDFQRLEGILLQYELLENEEIGRSLCVPVVSDTRFKLCNFNEEVLTSYHEFFDIETGDLKEPDRYNIIALRNGDNNMLDRGNNWEKVAKDSVFSFENLDLFQYRSLWALGGSSNMLRWRGRSGEVMTRVAPYGYDWLFFLEDRSTGNFFPIAMLPPMLNLYNGGFSISYLRSGATSSGANSSEATSLNTSSSVATFSNGNSSEATSLNTKFRSRFKLEDVSNVVMEPEPVVTLEVNDWSEVKPYGSTFLNKTYAFVEREGKRNHSKHYLNILGSKKFEESEVEYVRFAITGPLSGRNGLNFSYSSPGMALSNCSFSIDLGLDPLYFTMESRCIFVAYNGDLWKSVYLFLLPDNTLLLGISIEGRHKVFVSRRRLMPYKLSLLTFNLDLKSVSNWSFYLNGSLVEGSILSDDIFPDSFHLSDLTDLFFCCFPDVSQSNIVSALDSGVFSPGSFNVTHFILSVGSRSIESHRSDYRLGVGNNFKRDFRDLLFLPFTSQSYVENRIFCKVTGHPAFVHNA
jgi:hypothetical protein